jgi:hypothetical protein
MALNPTQPVTEKPTGGGIVRVSGELRELVIGALVAALVADVREAQAAAADGDVRTGNRPNAAA